MVPQLAPPPRLPPQAWMLAALCAVLGFVLFRHWGEEMIVHCWIQLSVQASYDTLAGCFYFFLKISLKRLAEERSIGNLKALLKYYQTIIKLV